MEDAFSKHDTSIDDRQASQVESLVRRAKYQGGAAQAAATAWWNLPQAQAALRAQHTV